VQAAPSVQLPEDAAHFDRDRPTAAMLAASATPLAVLLASRHAARPWRTHSLADALDQLGTVVAAVKGRETDYAARLTG
jgi:hypothetical protein